VRRLYLQVYVAFLGILLVFGILLVGAFALAPRDPGDPRVLDGLGVMVAELLPPDRPRAEGEEVLRRLAGALGIQATLWTGDGKLLAWAGAELPYPGGGRARSGWMRRRGGAVGALRLPDGRWLVARHAHRAPPHTYGVFVMLGLLALAVLVGAFPLARRLTRRLERLRAGVERLGAGGFEERVPVEGRDEVAALAGSFNQAADRIERLVGAQRAMLAGASHELRSPLARIRMAVELLGDEHEALKARMARDVGELDSLIEEVLTASRLQSVGLPERVEEVDLLGLCAEEASRVEVEAAGAPVTVRGDARLLRRLVRNLLDNALRHGGGAGLEVWAGPEGDQAVLRVCDRGPGVPEAERERIFDPFYQPPGAPAAGGSGLGLALVREIARHHGGDARCLAREGGGACFRVQLPRA
jgi:signal transduction histidine kinase